MHFSSDDDNESEEESDDDDYETSLQDDEDEYEPPSGVGAKKESFSSEEMALAKKLSLQQLQYEAAKATPKAVEEQKMPLGAVAREPERPKIPDVETKSFTMPESVDMENQLTAKLRAIQSNERMLSQRGSSLPDGGAKLKSYIAQLHVSFDSYY